jgi:hypothetical protein
MWYSTLEIAFISRHIFHKHWYTCPITLLKRRNPLYRNIFTVILATSTPPFQFLRYQWNVCNPDVNRFTRQTLPTVNMEYFFMNILCIESSFPTKRRNAQQNAGLWYYTPQARSPFSLLKPASEHVHMGLLPRLPWKLDFVATYWYT